MSYSKRRIILSFIILIASIVTSCNANNSETTDQSIDQSPKTSGQAHVAPKILFRDSMPKPAGYVNDYDSLYTPEQKQTLENLMADFEKRSTFQIALVVFDTLMVDKDSLGPVTKKIGENWGVGQKEKNNGIVIGICTGFHKMYISLGTGTANLLSEQQTKQIINDHFVPEFKKDNYYAGTLNGVKALMNVLGKVDEIIE